MSEDSFITNGENGGILIKNTTVRTGNWRVLKALTEVVFDIVLCNLRNPDGTQGALDGETLLAGDFIVGKFDSVKLTSGTLLAYVE